MSLVFRTDQTTPLTNDQLDNNFKYLRDQVDLKYAVDNFTAANISAQLRTTTGTQTEVQLAESNALNAWYLQGMIPTTLVPVISDKSSIVSRSSNGDITVNVVNGSLNGNAASATLAADANKLYTARKINGVNFDGTADITIADDTKLPILGGELLGKLKLKSSANNAASINFGSSSVAPETINLVNGDMWATTDGFFYRIDNVTQQVAQLNSPIFVGIPKAPGYTGVASQIVTISHIDNAVSTLNSSLATKAPLISPAFTGNPTVPTPPTGDNDTSIANTYFVNNAINSNATVITSDYQAAITAAITAYSNTVNQILTYKASLESPTFTGAPAAPTAAPGTNSTQLATTAFTTQAVADLRNILNGAVNALNDAIAQTRPVPVGAVFYMSGSTVPYGYFEANGQAVSQTVYADLWNFYGRPATRVGDAAGTFRIPDYRGEFLRGWDHGRGVDANRVLGSIQYSQNLTHTHDSPGGTNFIVYPAVTGQSLQEQEQQGGPESYSSRAPSTQPSGGNESRPRNVAIMPIIKW